MDNTNSTEISLFDLESKLVPIIAERCKTLRKKNHHSQVFGIDRSIVSKIENKIIPKSGNFITYNQAKAYSLAYDISLNEVVFGSRDEIKNIFLDIHYDMFRLAMLKHIDPKSDEAPIYASLTNLLCSFAEFNKQKHKLKNTEYSRLHAVSRFQDYPFIITKDKLNYLDPYTIYLNENTNWEIAIDLIYIENLIRLIYFDETFKSFYTYVCNIDSTYKFSSINEKLKKWILEEYIKKIVPQLEKTLRSNIIFKYGYLTHNLLHDYINYNIKDNHNKTVDIEVSTKPIKRVIINNTTSHFNELSEDDKLQRGQDIYDFIMGDKTPENLDKDVTIIDSPKSVTIENILINDVIEHMDATIDYRKNSRITIPRFYTHNKSLSTEIERRFSNDLQKIVTDLVSMQNNILNIIPDDQFKYLFSNSATN